jgi:hypothetical protein
MNLQLLLNASPVESHVIGRNVLLLRMASSGMLRRVAVVRTDVSEELSASFIKVTRICEEQR